MVLISGDIILLDSVHFTGWYRLTAADFEDKLFQVIISSNTLHTFTINKVQTTTGTAATGGAVTINSL